MSVYLNNRLFNNRRCRKWESKLHWLAQNANSETTTPWKTKGM